MHSQRPYDRTACAVPRHLLHRLIDFSIVVLACTCLPALALAPTGRDVQPGDSGLLATVWFFFRLIFVSFSPSRSTWKLQTV